MTVFDHEAIKKLKDMASLRDYKLNGSFSQRVFRSCPAISPQTHIASGEQLIHLAANDERKSDLNTMAVCLVGRIDFVEIDQPNQLVYIKDDTGCYVMYDCALQDLTMVE